MVDTRDKRLLVQMRRMRFGPIEKVGLKVESDRLAQSRINLSKRFSRLSNITLHHAAAALLQGPKSWLVIISEYVSSLKCLITSNKEIWIAGDFPSKRCVEGLNISVFRGGLNCLTMEGVKIHGFVSFSFTSLKAQRKSLISTNDRRETI